MSQLIDSILEELKGKYGLSKYELEKIVDSQFKYTVDHIHNKDLRYVKWKHLGKIRPSEAFIQKQTKQQEDGKLSKEV